ncbi:L-rhamnose mutarotase [Loigolactobacillus coryniformis]|jgi:L-rhamnose mutarotase|uniref:L-rhamnose mutarotase n=1 Tax=Loigolactobacillus coryniformis TaxID=1610 RepID=UPI00201AE11E|nr:L-rhamnose mutarotase [Loigolactobacillus coryniformis]MCL5458998.1 L-rhamnose mutarotase [Loigolactobacillus coryniformis]MDT3390791.1 L-rhamnose mutarotase [Bacillota bacterium]
MKRIGQIMYLHHDAYAEYQKRHNNLFPEMRQALKAAGAHNYSIFLNRATGQLFAYLEVADIEKYNAIANTAAAKKWWAYMKPLMDTNPDKSPVTVDLDEVFHLD